ncbi:MAG: transcription antitermination factor NusB [Oligoflexia bacterium]|nr:transcription antitermination factor NusB [Oligoflexia bacterium]
MGFRRRSREIALQILFQTEFTSHTPEQALALYLENFEADPETKEFAMRLVNGVGEHRQELDSIIQSHSQNWKVHRMAFVDKNILRIATFELKFLSSEIPTNVVIDEAIEIGKRFGSQETSSFVNGVLDNISKSLAG